MKLKFLLTMCIISATHGIKVRERLQKYKSGHARCIVSMSQMMPVESIPQVIFRVIIESSLGVLSDLNCTMKREHLTFPTKTPGPNETYDGYLGPIHRDEADIGLFSIRPDSLPGEPGKLTPPLASGDILIISAKFPGKTHKYDLTKFLDLGFIMYVYLFAAMIFLVPILYTYSEAKAPSSNDPESEIGMMQRFFKCCASVVNLILDQEQFAPLTLPGYILALTASLFALFAIHGIILNTVGADLVVIREKPPIDSLDDLLREGLTPILVNNSFECNILKTSRNNSEQHQLWQRVQERKSALTPDYENPGSTMQVIMDKMWNQEAVVLLPESCAEQAALASCLMESNKGDDENSAPAIHFSKETLSKGMLTGLMSHGIHPYTEKVLANAFTSAFEAGLFKGTTRVLDLLIPSLIPGTKLTSKTVICAEGGEEADQSPEDFGMDEMQGIFYTWLILLALSAVVWALELFFGRRKNKIDQMLMMMHE